MHKVLLWSTPLVGVDIKCVTLFRAEGCGRSGGGEESRGGPAKLDFRAPVISLCADGLGILATFGGAIGSVRL